MRVYEQNISNLPPFPVLRRNVPRKRAKTDGIIFFPDELSQLIARASRAKDSLSSGLIYLLLQLVSLFAEFSFLIARAEVARVRRKARAREISRKFRE